MSTLFSRIIAWEIPSYTIYEDEYVYAFLDIHPVQSGHTLLVPKVEISYFPELEEPYYSALFLAAKKIAIAIQKATNCTRVCTAFVWYEVPHVHYHLIPTNSIEEFQTTTTKTLSPEEFTTMQHNIIQYL